MAVFTAADPSVLAALRRDSVLGGILVQVHLPEMALLAPFLDPRDQTLTDFGLSDAVLMAFLHGNRGRGIDRAVPVGEALAFSSIWDGHDLLALFTRLVPIRSRPGITRPSS